jgi:formylmethanofuran dehydrogenase subunit A
MPETGGRPARLRIAGGEVYDPANGVDGAVRDVLVEGGRVVTDLSGPPEETIDAKGCVVMAGAVDIHSHVAGPAVNVSRVLRPEDHRHRGVPATAATRAGVGHTVPSTFTTGYRYAQMGYTTVMEAGVAPIGARHAHEELADTPIIDKAIYLLLGSNEFLLSAMQAGDQARVRDYLAWLLTSMRGFAAKLVNPGGVENWKSGHDVSGLDGAVDYFGVTPRQILRSLAEAADALRLPHPIHVHCNALGAPGNAAVTLETLRALEGHRAHLAHVQFHAYGGKDWAGFGSEAPALAKAISAQPGITCDVGQVVFGDATTLTADGPWQYRLHKLTGQKWYNMDVEVETGCGIVPYVYRERNYVNAMQWAIGLELFLLIDDPWKVFLSTDHPNGAPFMMYPHVVRLLTDRSFREAMLKRVHRRVLRTAHLPHIAREYTLSEIAVITRAGPARALGLARKGHLGQGADADVVVYPKRLDDTEWMFDHPVYVLKDGRVVVRDGEVLAAPIGRTLTVQVPWPQALLPAIRDYFEKYYTVQFDNYTRVDPNDIGRPEVVPLASP